MSGSRYTSIIVSFRGPFAKQVCFRHLSRPCFFQGFTFAKVTQVNPPIKSLHGGFGRCSNEHRPPTCSNSKCKCIYVHGGLFGHSNSQITKEEALQSMFQTLGPVVIVLSHLSEMLDEESFHPQPLWL